MTDTPGARGVRRVLSRRAGYAAVLVVLVGLVAGVGAVSSSPRPALAQAGVAPDITSSGPFAVDEGATAVTTLAAADPDTSAGDLVWSVAGGADAGAFALGVGGVLAFVSAKDYEAPDDADGDGSYEVSVRVSDGVSTDTADVAVTLGNVIELTAISGPATVWVAENNATRAATYSASSEADRDGIEWTLSGSDADHFAVDSPPGALRFHIDPVAPGVFPKLPDFEDPDDSDTDSSYSITLSAAAGSATPVTLAVTVTVTDADEPGAVSLSTARPSSGTAVAATLADPDGVTAGTATWQWERSTGPSAWKVIGGATASSYTPVAADTNAFLRVTATYDDEHGSSHSVHKATANVVTGPLLTALGVSTGDATAHPDRAMSPAFAAQTLHYAIGCAQNDTMQITLSAPPAARADIDGTQAPTNSTAVDMAVTSTSDVTINVTDAHGAHTAYHIHCLDDSLFEIDTFRHPGAEGIFDSLLMFRHDRYFVLLDSNGVPRHRRDHDLSGLWTWFSRVEPNGAYRYAFPGARTGSVGSPGVDRIVVLDEHLQVIDAGVQTAAPLRSTDRHAFAVLPNGNFLLISYEPPVARDLSRLTFADSEGMSYGSAEELIDSAIQIRTPGGSPLLTWNSWGKMPLEDCAQHRFARMPSPGYAHLNSIQMAGNLIIGSFRGCSKVLAIDATTGAVAWRVGRTNLSDDEWASRGLGPAPLIPVNDPEGEFCGQHSAVLLPNGHLLLYDNGAVCLIDPWTRSTVRTNDVYSRAVEYALDHDAGEAVFVRDHSLHGAKTGLGFSTGQVAPMDNGDWLVSWGRNRDPNRPLADRETVTQVDPATGQEKFAIRFSAGYSNQRPAVLATEVPADALAPRVGPLEASFPASEHSSVFHAGTGDLPQVVVAFSRPVADFDAASPSLRVTGAAISSVSAHTAVGEAANSYLVTLAPDGDGAVTLRVLAGEACAVGGICAADGTAVSAAPAPAVIGPPVTVSFERAASSVGEGRTLAVGVRLSAAHRGVRAVSVPVVLAVGDSASPDDVAASESVIFEAGESRKTLGLEALDDDLVEGAETVMLGFGALPNGVTAGATVASTVTVVDADRASVSFAATPEQVPEGAEALVAFAIDGGVTFERDQVIHLSVGGTAAPGDYVILDDADNELTAPLAIIFPAGETTADATVRAVDDAVLEPTAQTVTVSARLGLNNALLGTRTVTIQPSDVPGLPVVTVTGGAAVIEGETAQFVLRRTPEQDHPLSEPLTVFVQASAVGVALGGPARIASTFEAGSETAAVQVRTLEDRVVEQSGSVTLLVLASTSNPPIYLTEDPHTAAVTVDDNDVAVFTLSASAAQIAQGRAVTVTVDAGGVTFAEPQAIALTVAGTAAPGEDFTVAGGGRELSVPYTLTLPVGGGSVSATVRAALGGDPRVGKTIEIEAGHDGNAIGTVQLTIIAGVVQRPSVSAGSLGGGAAGGGGGGGAETGEAVLVVANGWSPADVATASVLAARTPSATVIYTAPDRLSAAARQMFSDYRPGAAMIVGGRAAVAAAVLGHIADVSAGTDVVRVAGDTRVHTAAAVARRVLSSPSDSPTLIVANGWSAPDVGMAAVLAARLGGAAVLYSRADELPDASARLIAGHAPERVILIGGTAAVRGSVERAIAAAAPGAIIERLGGADRVATAEQSARRALDLRADTEEPRTLIVANGWSAPDIGVAAALAARTPGAAVLYSRADELPDASARLIASHAPERVILIGGGAALSEAVAAAADSVLPAGTSVLRIDGASRTHTAAQAARVILGNP